MSSDLAEMPPKTRQKIKHADGDEREQHEDRAADARHPVALEPPDRRSGDRAEHRGEDDRHDDRRRLIEQPDQAEDDQHEADQQPRREAEVPEPGGSENCAVRSDAMVDDHRSLSAHAHHPVA